MNVVAWSLVIAWLVNHCMPLATPSDPGHFFIPLGKTYPSYSSWAVSVSISMLPYKKELAKIETATLALTVTTASLDRNAPLLNTSDPNQAALTIAVRRLTMSIKQLVNEGRDINSMYGDLLGLVSQSPDDSSRRSRDEPPPPDPVRPDRPARPSRPRRPARPTRRPNRLTRRPTRPTLTASPADFTSPSDTPRSLNNRRKRGLINGIGKIMSSLFGTATESEISHLTNNVRLINDKEMAIAHMFNGTLTVVNATRVATSQNRKALRSINRALEQLDQSHKRLSRVVTNTLEYVSISIHVTDLAEAIHQVTRAVHHLRSALSSLSDKLALARVGILHADLISSRTFARILRRINKALPANFALPYPISDLAKYIRIAKTKLVRVKDDYHILFYIPLLHTLHAYNIYRFFPYQVPLPGHNLSLSYVPDEPNYLIVSQNQQKYIQPKDSEIETCILDDHPFCQLHEPAYSTAGADSCLVALFREDTPLTAQYCAPFVRPSNDAPKAYYLSNGKWVIVSNPPTRFTVVCPSSSEAKTLRNTVEILDLPIECSASGDSVYLPPYYASETSLDLPDFQPTSVPINGSAVPIWRPRWTRSVTKSLNITPMYLPALHISGMPADKYFNEIEQLPLERVEDPATFSRSWIVMIVISTLAIITLACFLRCCCPGSSRDVISLARLRRYRMRPTNPDNEPMELLEPIAPSIQPADQAALLPDPPQPPTSTLACAVPATAPTDPVTHRSPGPATSETAFPARGKPVAAIRPQHAV